MDLMTASSGCPVRESDTAALQLTGGALTVDERVRISAAARTSLAVGGAVTRFYEEMYELKTGVPADAVSGLDDRLKVQSCR